MRSKEKIRLKDIPQLLKRINLMKKKRPRGKTKSLKKKSSNNIIRYTQKFSTKTTK